MSADPWGFTRFGRVDPPVRPVGERVHDWLPLYRSVPPDEVQRQANRCMDCGVPFCHAGCPLGNLIPEWNELVATQDWREAAERLHATNNFPEFTGWLCPAPCEDACVLTLTGEGSVTIKEVELAIIDRAWQEGWVSPQRPRQRTGARVAVVGSGPAGLAAAQQLTRAGHAVVVLERQDHLGGLLRYGIPDFKLEKRLIDRRIAQMAAEGTTFVVRTEVGSDVGVAELQAGFDAVVLACGATQPRDVQVPGRGLVGVHQAMDYLPQANRAVRTGGRSAVDASGKNVVIIGGGDTAADCLGTARRQGALAIHQIDHNPEPPRHRDVLANPWPQVARVHPSAPVYSEGVSEEWATEVVAFEGDERGRVRAVRGQHVRAVYDEAGTRSFVRTSQEFRLDAELVLLAAGFTGPESAPWLAQCGVAVSGKGRVSVDQHWRTDKDGVWACGDATRGASLVVWAIAQGRACAAAVGAALGDAGGVPAVVTPATQTL